MLQGKAAEPRRPRRSRLLRLHSCGRALGNTCSMAISACLNQTVPSAQKRLSLSSTLTLQLPGAAFGSSCDICN